MNRLLLIIGSLMFLIVVGYFLKNGKPSPETPAPQPEISQTTEIQSLPPLEFVGTKTCIPCHTKESELWENSHHDLAMQEANQKTVLGNFNDTTFKNFGITSRFHKQGKQFFVTTDGPDGSLQDYKVTHTFGVTPLQQYLIQFPDGRYQALGIAWDTRSQEEGGQRWFHLYPDEQITHDDELHWTGPNQNWNYMCAECHSTNLQKNYNLETNQYNTTWTDMNVACEACHGPGSRHVAWGNDKNNQENYQEDENKELIGNLPSYKPDSWQFTEQAHTARRHPQVELTSELDICARCHSRRRTIKDPFQPGKPFLDTHLPALLEQGLYYPDGQMQDEVYVYGSFLQSKMYRAGVTCRDCHEPHGLTIREQGNALCTRCHRSEHFDTSSHHGHQADSVGAQCVNCHMPAKNYMVVDPRRDHSLRIPRPDLSEKLGTPNACNQCHDKKSAQWAAKIIKNWHTPSTLTQPHYGEDLKDGFEEKPGADLNLIRLAQEIDTPGIARGTALSLLRAYPSQAMLTALQLGTQDKDPLVRIGALRAFDTLPLQQRFDLGAHLLNDPIRAVRTEAGRYLAAVSPTMLTSVQREQLRQALDEFVQSQMVNAERPSSFLNLGIVYGERGEMKKSEKAYQTALQLDPSFYPALVNLADLYRLQKRDREGEPLLRKALTLAPNDASVHHALGLLLIRTGKKAEAMPALKKAWELQPDNSRYGYVYGIALNSMGKPEQALKALEVTYLHHPTDRQLLMALISMNRDLGNAKAAQKFIEKLQTLAPPPQSNNAASTP